MLKDVLLRKIKFQIQIMRILKEYDRIFVVLDCELKKTFLENTYFYYSQIRKLVPCKDLSHSFVMDPADVEMLVIKFDY